MALIGATGFIGRHVAAALVAAGNTVRALVRPGRRAPSGVAAWPGDAADAVVPAGLLDGAQVLVNCAGSVRGACRADFVPANEALVQRLAAQARAGGHRLVHLSSLAAREPALSDYAASKAAGEALISASGAAFTVLRPPAVYGPGDTELRPLLDGLRSGAAVVPGSRDGRFALLYVSDLAAAVVAAVQADPTGQVHELHDGTLRGYGWPDVAGAVQRQCGRRVRWAYMPGGVLRTAARVNLHLARRRGRAPMLTPGKARELMHPDWTVRDTSFTAATGWRARVGLEEGLARTFAAGPGAG